MVLVSSCECHFEIFIQSYSIIEHVWIIRYSLLSTAGGVKDTGIFTCIEFEKSNALERSYNGLYCEAKFIFKLQWSFIVRQNLSLRLKISGFNNETIHMHGSARYISKSTKCFYWMITIKEGMCDFLFFISWCVQNERCTPVKLPSTLCLVSHRAPVGWTIDGMKTGQ